MIKRARVLRVFHKTGLNYNTLKSTLDSYNLNLEIKPEYNDDIRDRLFQKISNSTCLLCITQNEKNSLEEDFAFICSNVFSKNTAIYEGDIIWYFEDKTFSESTINNNYIFQYFFIAKYNDPFNNRFSLEENFNTPIRGITPKEINDLKYLDMYTSDGIFRNNSLIRIGDNEISSFSSNVDIISNVSELNGGSELTNFAIDKCRISLFTSTYNDTNLLYYNSIINFLSKSNEIISNVKNNDLLTNSSYDEKPIFEKISKYNNNYNNKNISRLEYDDDDSLLSNIAIKASNIYLISSENDDEEENKVSVNSIKLLRESYDIQKESHICLDEDSDITLDGKKIYVGNFKRYLVHQNILTSDDVLDDDVLSSKDEFDNLINNLPEEKKTLINNLCGKGEGILLGYEKSLSEPLVLGNTLSVILKDIIELLTLTIDQNKVLNDKVNSLAQEYTSHTHPNGPMTASVLTPAGVPFPAAPVANVIPVPTLPTTNIAQHQTFSSSDTSNITSGLDEIQEKLDVVKSNLKYILSRFVKTT